MSRRPAHIHRPPPAPQIYEGNYLAGLGAREGRETMEELYRILAEQRIGVATDYGETSYTPSRGLLQAVRARLIELVVREPENRFHTRSVVVRSDGKRLWTELR